MVRSGDDKSQSGELLRELGSGRLFSRHRGIRTGLSFVTCNPRELGCRPPQYRDCPAISHSRSRDRISRDAACGRSEARVSPPAAPCHGRARGFGSPSRLLYAESAGECLAYHLIQGHSTLSKAPGRTLGGLPVPRLRVVKNYIEENLGNPITLRELASRACVSV